MNKIMKEFKKENEIIKEFMKENEIIKELIKENETMNDIMKKEKLSQDDREKFKELLSRKHSQDKIEKEFMKERMKEMKNEPITAAIINIIRNDSQIRKSYRIEPLNNFEILKVCKDCRNDEYLEITLESNKIVKETFNRNPRALKFEIDRTSTSFAIDKFIDDNNFTEHELEEIFNDNNFNDA